MKFWAPAGSFPFTVYKLRFPSNRPMWKLSTNESIRHCKTMQVVQRRMPFPLKMHCGNAIWRWASPV